MRSQGDWCLIKRVQRCFTMWGHTQKGSGYEPGSDPSPELNHTGTSILNFQHPELQNQFLFFISHQVSDILLYQHRWTKVEIRGVLFFSLLVCWIASIKFQMFKWNLHSHGELLSHVMLSFLYLVELNWLKFSLEFFVWMLMKHLGLDFSCHMSLYRVDNKGNADLIDWVGNSLSSSFF